MPCLQARSGAARPEHDDGDVDDVQQHRGERRRAEAVVDLEDRAEERGAADQQHVGQHDGGELEGEQPSPAACRARARSGPERELADDRDRQQHHAEEIDAGGGEVVGAAQGWLRPFRALV